VTEVLRPEGPLTMATATAYVEAARAKVKAGDLTVDLSAVTAADSAALALLFDCRRGAASAGHRMSVVALPEGLRSLAALYGVDELLPAEAPPAPAR